MSRAAVISGVGLVLAQPGEFPRANDLALRATKEACADAGIAVADIDGLLLNHNELIADDRVTLDFGRQAGFGQLSLLAELDAKGTTFSTLLDHATQAVQSGRAETVVVLFADAAIQPGRPSGSAFAAMGGGAGQRGLERAGGMLGAVAAYSFLTRHYMQAVGVTEDDLCAIAVAQRTWAAGNPLAWNREPLTADEYFASPYVAEPLRRLDCARPVSGAVAMIVTSADRARNAVQEPITVRGSAQRSSARRRHAPVSPWEPTGARAAFDDALAQAGVVASGIDVLGIYDPFTIVPLMLLEEFGFADRGRAGEFVRAGQTGAGGSMPTNTGGGQISGYYLQGSTSVIEVIAQLRGVAGERQVSGAATGVVAAIGGRMEHHSTLVLTAGVA